MLAAEQRTCTLRLRRQDGVTLPTVTITLNPRLTLEAFRLGCVARHAKPAISGQSFLEHLGGALVIAFPAAIQQRSGVQAAQVGKLEPIAHLLGDLAGDAEVVFGFLPTTSRCSHETGTGHR